MIALNGSDALLGDIPKAYAIPWPLMTNHKIMFDFGAIWWEFLAFSLWLLLTVNTMSGGLVDQQGPSWITRGYLARAV